MIRFPLIIAFICFITLIQPSLCKISCSAISDGSNKDFCIKYGGSGGSASERIASLITDFPYIDFGEIDNMVPPFSIYVNAYWPTNSTQSLSGITTGLITLYSLGNPSANPTSSDKSGCSAYQDILELYLNDENICLNYYIKSADTTSVYCTSPTSFSLISNVWYTVGFYLTVSSSGVYSLTLQIFYYDGENEYYQTQTFYELFPLPSGKTRHALLGLPPLGYDTNLAPFLDEFRIFKIQLEQSDLYAYVTFNARVSLYQAACQNLIVWYPFDDRGDGSSPANQNPTGPNIPFVGNLGTAAEDEDGNVYTNSMASGINSLSFQITPDPTNPFLKRSIYNYKEVAKRSIEGVNDCYGYGDPHVYPFDNGAYFVFAPVTGVNAVWRTEYANPTCNFEGVYEWASCSAIGFTLYTGVYKSTWSYCVNGFGTLNYGTDVIDFYAAACHHSGQNTVALNGVVVTGSSGKGSSGVVFTISNNVLYVTGSGLYATFTFQSAIYIDITVSFSSPCSYKSNNGGICGGVVSKVTSCVYGAWSACSASCNADNNPPTQVRYLTVGGSSCATSQVEYCNNVQCPCYYGPFSSCSASCNYGTETQNLIVATSGASCARSITQTCMLKECACYYTAWTDCTAPCNGGTQYKTLLPNYPSGYSCANKVTQACNTQTCPPCEYQDSNPDCNPICGTGAIKTYVPITSESEWCSSYSVPCNVSCDHNECDEYNACDTTSTVCENIVCGSPSCYYEPTYECNCLTGYYRSADNIDDGSYECTSIDFCANASLNDCDLNANCYNTPGSYYCVCLADYFDTSLKHDGTSCYPNCNQTEWSDCVGVCDGIGTSTRATAANLLYEPRCQPLSRDCNMSACAPIPEVTCNLTALGTEYETAALDACACVDEVTYPTLYESCLFDLCVGQDLTIAASHCSVSQEECLKDLLQAASLDPTTTASPSDCPQVCVSSCSGHGTCDETLGCICNSGWTGIDCRLTTSYFCFTSTWNDIERQVAGYRYDMGAVMNSTTLETYFTEDSFQVLDSVLIYFLESITDSLTYTPVHHLFIMNDNSDTDSDGGSYTLSITTSSGDFSSVSVNTGLGVTLDPNWKSASMSWSAYTSPRSGMYVTDLPSDFCMDISVTNVGSGVTQLLFGTGTGSPTANTFEVMKVPYDSSSASFSTVKVCSTACVDTCSSYNDCSNCTSQSACGWCRDTGECQAGSAVGPSRGECENWRFSTSQNVSRRLTLELGYPVTYDGLEVYLTDEPANSADLPQFLSIDVTSPTEIVWDVLLVIPNNRPAFTTSIYNALQEIITKLRNFPTLDIAVVSFYADQVDVHLVLTSSWQYMSDFETPVESIASSTSDTTQPVVTSILETLAGTSLTFGWRTNSRRAVLFFADLDYILPEIPFADQQLAILEGGYYPIFVVSPSLVDSYSELVSELEFGSVVAFYEDTVGSTTSAALSLASTTVSLVITQAGHIDESQNEDSFITGLSKGMRARFTYVFEESSGIINESILIAPGFGSVTVESVVTDHPVCDPVSITVKENSIDPVVGSRGLLISLAGYTYKDYPMYFKITSLPAKGTLYQWTGQSTYQDHEITEPETVVYDTAGRVFYVPPLYGQSIDNEPYVTFEYVNNDLCYDSAACLISVYLTPVAYPPVATSFNVSVYEDQTAEFNISDYKFSYDLTDPYGEEQATSWGIQSNPHSFIRWNSTASGVASLNTYSTDTYFYIVLPKDLNGDYVIPWMAQDTSTLALSNPASIFLHIIHVNDPPTISAATPITGKMNTWFSISITISDIDSVTVTLNITLPSTFKGTLVDNATNETVTSEQTWTAYGVFEVPHSKVITFNYIAPYDEYSCDLLNTDTTNCTAQNNTFTSFSVHATDTEGAKSQNITVDLIILNTDKAPTTASNNFTIYMYEEITYNTSFNGVSSDSYSLVSYVVNLPEGLTVYQYPESDGIILDSPGLITDSSNRLVFVPPEDTFGDENNDWYYTFISYRVFDGLFYSDTATVNIHLIALNKPPVPITNSIETNEDTPIVVALFATDKDNTIDQLTFILTSIIPSSVGTFYQYNSSASYYIGAEISQNDTVPVQNCTTYGGVEVTAACFVFNPACLYYLNGTGVNFTYSVTDIDVYHTSQAYTVDQSASVVVKEVNHAPIAEMTNPSIYEDAYSTITLGYWDRENDAVYFIITSAPSEGTLYQFSEDIVNGDTSGAVIIDTTVGEVEVTDSQGRIVYLPPKHKNTETSIDYLYYAPTLSYYVSEISPRIPPSLSSGTTDVYIFIYEVNDPPCVWGEDGCDVIWNVTGNGTCYSYCTFDEDFKTEYPLTVGTRKISLGGYDIEWHTLMVYVESISCPDSPDTLFWDATTGVALEQGNDTVLLGSNLTITGDSTEGFAALKILVAFTPFLDQNRYTCTIVYKVSDGEYFSVSSKTIEFYINPINDPPRLTEDAQTTFWTIENQDVTFTPSLYDVEDNIFNATVIALGYTEGVFLDYLGNTLSAGSGLPGNSSNTTEWAITFVPANDESGSPMNSITLRFNDQQSYDPISTFTFYVNVYAVNQAPTLTWVSTSYTITDYSTFNTSDAPSADVEGPSTAISVSIVDSSVASAGTLSLWSYLYVYDIDAGARSIECNISATTGTFTLTISSDIPHTTNSDNSYYYILASQDKITSILNTLSWTAPSGITSAVVTIYVNDLGWSGYCYPNSTTGAVSSSVCPKSATLTVSLSGENNLSLITIVAVSSGAAAAGAILIGVLGVLLFRRLSDEASSAEFQPWDEASFGNVANVNPLFESAEIGGSSPIYEAANNTDYVALTG